MTSHQQSQKDRDMRASSVHTEQYMFILPYAYDIYI